MSGGRRVARRVGVALLAVGLALLTLGVGCSAGSGSAPATAVPPRQVEPPLEPVRALYPAVTAALLPYWAASEAGGFARNGLRVELLETSDAPGAYARLLKGEVEVYLTPLTPELAAQAADGADLAILGGTPELVIVTTRRLLSTREFILERYLRGVLEGIHAVQTRPDFARDLLLRQGGLASPEQADQALQSYLGKGGAERVPYLARADVEALLAQALPPPRAESVDADRLLEQSILRRLEASGFVAGLYRV